jgi:splicing factor U2AF subunit
VSRLLILLALVTACSKSDDSSSKKRDRDRDRDEDRDDDRDRKKKRDRDRDDDRDDRKEKDRDRDRDDDRDDLEDEALRGLARYRDDMCDCKDAACGDSVKRDFKEWRKKMKSKTKEFPKLDERTMKRIMAIQSELQACEAKLDKPKPVDPPGSGTP